MEVASGAVRGVSTIYMSLENAAATLATSLSDNTVKVVTHKFVKSVFLFMVILYLINLAFI